MKLTDSLKELNMSARTQNILLRMGINTVGEFLSYPRSDISKLRQIGDVSMTEIEQTTQSIIKESRMKEFYKKTQGLSVVDPNYYPVADTDISKEAIATLGRVDIRTVQELLNMENHDVFNIDGISLSIAEELVSNICEFNPIKLSDPFDSELLIKNQPLNARAVNALENAGVFTINQLLAITEPELLNIKNIGEFTLNEILSFRKELYDKNALD